jgi:cell division septal protein FtsQ
MASYRRPHRIRRKRQILKSRFFWFSILFLIIFGGIFYFFVLSDFFQIKKIIITGEQKVSTEDIKSVVENELGRKILFFGTKNIFFVNLNKIRENILKKFPQIEEVEVKRGLPDALHLVVIERKEIGIFCRDINCFLLDHEGVIFESASSESPLLKFQNQVLNGELDLGKKVIDKGIIDSISEIGSKLREDLKILIEEVSIVSEENIHVKTSESWEIYFNPEKDLDWQMTELAAILENRIPLEKRKNLKYIDLRFDKVYIFPETYNQ